MLLFNKFYVFFNFTNFWKYWKFGNKVRIIHFSIQFKKFTIYFSILNFDVKLIIEKK